MKSHKEKRILVIVRIKESIHKLFVAEAKKRKFSLSELGEEVIMKLLKP